LRSCRVLWPAPRWWATPNKRARPSNFPRHGPPRPAGPALRNPARNFLYTPGVHGEQTTIRLSSRLPASSQGAFSDRLSVSPRPPASLVLLFRSSTWVFSALRAHPRAGPFTFFLPRLFRDSAHQIQELRVPPARADPPSWAKILIFVLGMAWVHHRWVLALQHLGP